MKNIILALALFGFLPAYAEETVGETTEAKVRDAGRDIKKSAHRAKEKLCAKGDVACLKDKAKHRGQEAKDYIGDKYDQTKDKVDNN
jgi:hypothetical protein